MEARAEPSVDTKRGNVEAVAGPLEDVKSRLREGKEDGALVKCDY